MEITFPANFISKDGRIPCGQKELMLKEVNKVFYGTSSGDPRSFQHEIDITHVHTPSLITIRPMVLRPPKTSIENATWYGRCGLTSEILNLAIMLTDSILPIASKSASHCEGQI